MKLPINFSFVDLRIFRDMAAQLNGISEGRMSARHTAAALAPNTGTWAVGDFVTNSSPAVAGSVGSQYVVTGWLCTVSGTPGTWVEARTLTGVYDSASGSFSHRNKIINGGFAVNQRAYVSGAATTAGQYTLDRWKVTTTSGITFSTTANKTTVTIPTGQTIQQVIEGLNLQSGTYVLSWEGTAHGKIGAGSYGASGITGSITGGSDTAIEFNAGTVANVQLEFGSVATPFEHRPYGTELALCQRYYETGVYKFFHATSPDTLLAAAVNFREVKLSTPSLTYTTGGVFNYAPDTTEVITTSYFAVNGTAGGGVGEIAFLWAATSEL